MKSNVFIAAAGVALVLEGLPYFLLAERMPEYLRSLAEQPPSILRMLGLGAMLVGLLFVYMSR